MAWEFYVGILEQSLDPCRTAHKAWRYNSGNLFVVDAGDANGNGNAIYKFTLQGVRTPFRNTLNESFVGLAFQPLTCCQ
jgi:hypothetical protein